MQKFHHHAMATPWVVSIAGEDPDTAAWAAQEAFVLVDRLEEDLSRFQPTSYISQLGRLTAGESLRVSPEAYECLVLAKAVWTETAGAFDVTVRGEATEPQDDWRSQMSDLEFIDGHGIQVAAEGVGVSVDLGGIGKGFAVDEITQFFNEHEIANALIDAGGSTLYGLGTLPGESEGWPASLGTHGIIALQGRALSASGFEVKGHHVIDPRTGSPVETDRQRAWVMAGSAALADALSTAALIMSEEEIGALSAAHPDLSIMLA